MGIIAVDPTSPYSGGAILGDRVRMQAHAGDDGVFIRSMATRGHLGGLSRATHEAACVLDAAGKDWVVIETVGVGQDEVDIVRTADIVDRRRSCRAPATRCRRSRPASWRSPTSSSSTRRTARAPTGWSPRLKPCSRSARSEPGAWRPPIVRTQATAGTGVPDLLAAIEAFRAHTATAQRERRRLRQEFRLRELLADRFMEHVDRHVLGRGRARRHAASGSRIARLDPYTAADGILERALGRKGTS